MEQLSSLLAYKGIVVLGALALLLVLERIMPVARLVGGVARIGRNLSLAGLNAVFSWAIVVPLSAIAAAHALDWRPPWWSGCFRWPRSSAASGEWQRTWGSRG